MSRRRRGLSAALLAVAVLAPPGCLGGSEEGGISRGPSTTTDPYALPVADGVSIKSLLTVGDEGAAGNGYEMAGIPDGLAAYGDPAEPTITVLMNNELYNDVGVRRRHGEKGAFVEELKLNTESFEIEQGRDLIGPGVRYWDYPAARYSSEPSRAGPNPRRPGDSFPGQSAAFSRFCSSSLTPPEALLAPSGRGYDGQIYFANEEYEDEGRVFGVTLDGQAQQLPHLGLATWENTQLAETGTDLTLTIGSEDASEGQLWVHSGRKQAGGDPFARAGLSNGRLQVVDLADEAVSTDSEFREAYGKGEPAPFTLGPRETVAWDQSGAAQNREAARKGLTLNRIEDGAWDPNDSNSYYFTTTVGGDTAPDPDQPDTPRDGGGLWRMTFEDVRQPQLGGTLTLLLDGSEEPLISYPDNITIDREGNLLIQEDPEPSPAPPRILAYDIETEELGVIAELDPELFGERSEPGFITDDKESSGILDAGELIGRGWFLFDVQVHARSEDPAAFEYGQLLAMRVADWDAVYSSEG